MSLTTPQRRLLPLLPAHPGGRSAMTCRYRCGNACFHDAPNTSSNEYFGDVMAQVVSRRTVLQAGAVLGLVGAVGTSTGAPATAAHPVGDGAPGLKFSPVAPNTTDAVVVPPGYLHEVVLRWGDPLFKDGPEFDPMYQSAEAQERQFGYNCDYLGLLPRSGRGNFLLVANHEYTNEEIMFPGYDPENPTREQVEVAWAAHSLSVVALTAERRGRRSGGLDAVVGHRLNRRFTMRSEFELSGPAAGDDLVSTKDDPEGRTVLGTLNNCAGGLTPWDTWLTGEENFHQYFANAGTVTDTVAAERLRRYGVTEGPSDRKWELYDDRFDVAAQPNEPNRFGWVCEIDPFDPDSTPRKRTALGRFKHEGATIRLTPDGRAAAYMGDDERFDYVYKFVSRDEYRKGDHEHNATLLDNGTLYVARFTGDSPGEITGTGALPADGEFDGSGEWIPLATSADGEAESHVEGMSGVEVLVFTRLAGDAVGATKMDRPEDVEPHPQTGRVYMALTNNTNRGLAGYAGPDEANPRTENKHGHVIELRESGDDAASTTFAWRILLVCGDPEDPSTYFDGYDKSQVSPISCPDNVTFDSHGNLWIATDGNALGSNDGLFGVALEGEHRGQVKQFLTVPVGAETCGPWVEDHRVLVHVQHPGEADGSTFEHPVSHWPDGGVPRPSLVVAWRADGREIGSA
ncbi:PhoX family phosphatase [Georgenia sp. EYE_87]|uniref:PhoX family protein n=1 Tax=Georgenia sp. EYE_87 TaxID=2853448 RepID=UPI002006AB5B|nr:PhoX family phosphatase [Georgenia sp. EYE_87]MCK6209367.1 PhoX family phosphatase [Georgenia sp. EYE_87]